MRRPISCSIVAALIILGTGPLHAQGISPLRTSASFWSYEALCNIQPPPDEATTMKTLTDVSVSFVDCAKLEKKWGKPAAVLLRLENGGAATEDVVLAGDSLAKLEGVGAPRPAIAVLLRKPDTQGHTTLTAVEKLDGKMAFPVAPGKAISLVFFFSEARAGDRIAFGDLPPVSVNGDAPATVPAQPPRLTATASLWTGDICDTPPKKPSRISFKGSFEMETCRGTGKAVLVEISNAGGGETTVTLTSLDSIKIKRAAGDTKSSIGVVLTMPGPMGRGSQTSMVNKIEGELGFPVEAGQTIQIIAVFSGASKGDSITFGNVPAARLK